MPWVQSHSNLRTHPKLKRAARMAGCSPVEMSGHLHWLWWWALETQPDGDLSVWEPEDIADAAGWEGDPHTFVTALLDCGPGDKRGFLDPDMRLHDWDEYGGAYRRKVEAGRESAKRRWDREKVAKAAIQDAVPLATYEQEDRLLMGTHWVPNAEERRGEKKEPLRTKPKRAVAQPRPRNELWDAVVEACGWNGQALTKSQQGRTASAVKELSEIGAEPAEVRRRAANYRLKYPGMDVTPTALSANWASIASGPSGVYTDPGRGGVYFND
jgi:hypothetical protein